jgi:hypothetical protein
MPDAAIRRRWSLARELLQTQTDGASSDPDDLSDLRDPTMANHERERSQQQPALTFVEVVLDEPEDRGCDGGRRRYREQGVRLWCGGRGTTVPTWCASLQLRRRATRPLTLPADEARTLTTTARVARACAEGAGSPPSTAGTRVRNRATSPGSASCRTGSRRGARSTSCPAARRCEAVPGWTELGARYGDSASSTRRRCSMRSRNSRSRWPERRCQSSGLGTVPSGSGDSAVLISAMDRPTV